LARTSGVTPDRVKNFSAVLEQARQDLVDVLDRKRVIGTVVHARAFESGAPAVPDFLFGIALPAK
jgi:hypothetical protein